ncbi:MAG TPA: pyridoxamine 5'-phosphate oxidase family protein [Anaerovoracaceae bacterium]|nr:pyridoxamine 5'-phosphate oxidase family protein [Anaerovoracaceae bacterium]
MQHRMKTHPLTDEQIKQLLCTTLTGSLATLGSDGAPYVTPIHFVSLNGDIYFHGLPMGQKLDNIKADPRVSMTIYQMDRLLLDTQGKPCDTNTKYQSVILSGNASFINDIEGKKEILTEVVKKYTPQLSGNTLPENMIKGTAVIKITVESITGKYYD